MILICLGNTGEKYKKTRHNVGRMFGRYLVSKFRVSSCEFKKDNIGRVWKLENGWQVVFLDCYMNNSGPCLKNLLSSSNLTVEQFNSDLIVVHDDLDIPLGKFKIQQGRGSAGHRGVESVINALVTSDFKRIRIGIGRNPDILEEKYVLMKFNKEERKKLADIFEKILIELERK